MRCPYRIRRYFKPKDELPGPDRTHVLIQGVDDNSQRILTFNVYLQRTVLFTNTLNFRIWTNTSVRKCIHKKQKFEIFWKQNFPELPYTNKEGTRINYIINYKISNNQNNISINHVLTLTLSKSLAMASSFLIASFNSLPFLNTQAQFCIVYNVHTVHVNVTKHKN